jgi:ABC-2 type transport system permease protein
MNLRMHVVNAVFKRNFLSYFSGVIGYLSIVLFVLMGSLFAFSDKFFANNLANLDQLNALFPILLLLFVPAVTMSSWADERKQGTDELLFTLPASDLEILLGKYAAVMGIYLVALFFSLSHVIVLVWLGSPDWGVVFTTYLGYAVVGSALLSAGMLASVLTSSTTVAYVLGVVFCAIPIFIDWVAPVFDAGVIGRILPVSRLLQGLSIADQFRDFTLGMIPLGGLLYFVSLTVLFLYLNLVFISRRHWSGGPHQTPMWAHYLIRAVALGAILISVNVASAGAALRLDLTGERLYSLSPTTKQTIAGLESNRPVLIQAFISPEVPRDLVSVRSTLIGLLRQYDQAGGNKVRVRIVNTEKFTDAADDAKRYGIESQDVQSERQGRIVRDDVYLGVVITSVDEQVIIPFFDKGTPVEYELTRSIRTVSESNRKTVGILRTDAQVTGGFDMQSFRQLPEWRIAHELKKQYDVKSVSPDELATGNYDVLVAIMPSSLTDPEMTSFVSYINRGKPTLVIDDPFPVFQPGLAPRNPKPRPGGMFGQGGPMQEKSDRGQATKLSSALGIQWDSGQTVWDRYDPHPEIREMLEAVQLPDVVYISTTNRASQPINSDSRITRGLQEVMMFYPGSISPAGGSNLKFEPLLKSSPDSVTHEWEEYVNSGFMGMTQLIIPDDKGSMRDAKSRVIAARITGTPSASKDGKEGKAADLDVVFVAEMDMISNPFFFIRDKEWQGLKLDNITFVLNAVDELAGEHALLALRGRQAVHRTLTTIESRVKDFRTTQVEESAKADKEAKDALDEVNKALQKDIDKIDADTSLDPQTKRIMKDAAVRNQQQVLDVKKANIENGKKRKVKDVKERTEREIRAVENVGRTMAIILPPIPALILGILFFAYRLQGERQGIVPDRLVGKK